MLAPLFSLSTASPSPLFSPPRRPHSQLPPPPPAPREFHKSSAELAAELERAAPTMTALEQYGAVKAKEREQVCVWWGGDGA